MDFAETIMALLFSFVFAFFCMVALTLAIHGFLWVWTGVFETYLFNWSTISRGSIFFGALTFIGLWLSD